MMAEVKLFVVDTGPLITLAAANRPSHEQSIRDTIAAIVRRKSLP